MGHAATYVAFDLLNRAWRSAGHEVRYVQNVTDVDDPLLERANATGEDWAALAERETELFRSDMEALRVLAPDAYVGAVEAIPLVVDMVEQLQAAGSVYDVPSPGSGTARSLLLGHPRSRFRRGVRLEPRGDAARLRRSRGRPRPSRQEGPPGLPAVAGGAARRACLGLRARPRPPGWHVECSAIARAHLGAGMDVQGGGSDLVFPHHEMSASEAQVADPGSRFARAYVHAGMVGPRRREDVEVQGQPRARLQGARERPRPDGDPSGPAPAPLSRGLAVERGRRLGPAGARLDKWRSAVAKGAGAPTAYVVTDVLTALANDLDAPFALRLLDRLGQHHRLRRRLRAGSG